MRTWNPRAGDESSECIGRMLPGRVLKMVDLESPATSRGVLRACVALTAEDRSGRPRPLPRARPAAFAVAHCMRSCPCTVRPARARTPVRIPVHSELSMAGTWRELYPQQQHWRTPSWRAHIEEEKQEKKRSLERAKQDAQRLRLQEKYAHT